MKSLKLFVSLLLLAAIFLGSQGCPSRRPNFLVAFIASTSSLDFGANQVSLTFTVAKVATSRPAPPFTVSANQPWIAVTPLTGNSTGPENPVTITVTINRSLMGVGTNNGVVTISAPGVQPITVQISATAQIVADFFLTPSLPTVDFPVAFTSISTVAPGQPPINSLFWNFGDGSPPTTAIAPIHTYTSTGTFNVSLTASNGVVSDTRVRQIVVTGPVGPTAEFVGSPLQPFVGQVVQFTDLSIPGTAPIDSYLWDFGDGATSFNSNPTHAYALAGSYDVYLLVTTIIGMDEEVKLNYINVANVPPTADFTADDRTPVSGQAVQFMDLSNLGIPPHTWFWTFGDGMTSALQNPVHIYTISSMYAASAAYTVSLTVTNGVGMDTETKPNFIVVSPAP